MIIWKIRTSDWSISWAAELYLEIRKTVYFKMLCKNSSGVWKDLVNSIDILIQYGTCSTWETENILTWLARITRKKKRFKYVSKLPINNDSLAIHKLCVENFTVIMSQQLLLSSIQTTARTLSHKKALKYSL